MAVNAEQTLSGRRSAQIQMQQHSYMQSRRTWNMNPMHILKLPLVFAMVTASAAFAEPENLPVRSGPRPLTTEGVPHVQIGVEAVPEISAELLRRVSNIPGVEVRDTVVSLPGAKGFWLNEELTLARPDVIVGGREFAHLHPDGSLHASLSPELAARAIESGWAVLHPWADERPGWEGFVMIYTPGSMDEMEAVFQLVLGSYSFVTGKDLAVSDG